MAAMKRKRKSKPPSREVMTEAKRIARSFISSLLKLKGRKRSEVKASDMITATNRLLIVEPRIIKQAKRNIKRMEKEAYDIP
jgi:hypothetical protein